MAIYVRLRDHHLQPDLAIAWRGALTKRYSGLTVLPGLGSPPLPFPPGFTWAGLWGLSWNGSAPDCSRSACSATHGGQRMAWRSDHQEAERKLQALHGHFRAVSRRWDRPARLRRIYRRATWGVPAVFGVALLSLGLTGPLAWNSQPVDPSAWSADLRDRHHVAAKSCGAARAVGLAPAVKWQPGYWPQHDQDSDGIACEPRR